MSDGKAQDRWIDRARMDIRAVRDLLMDDSEQMAPLICSLAYQAVEKMLKAFLLSREAELSRTHDLTLLFRKCLALDEGFAAIQPQMEAIFPFAPDEWSGCFFGETDEGRALEAYEKAVEIQGYIIDRMPA